MTMRFSDNDIQAVKNNNDLVRVIEEYTEVRPDYGTEKFQCCCPLHHEKTPSLKIDGAKQRWHCFGCGAGGDVIKFVMAAENMSFPHAVRKLAERGNVTLTT